MKLGLPSGIRNASCSSLAQTPDWVAMSENEHLPCAVLLFMDLAAKEISKDHYSQRAGHIKAELQIGEGTTNAPGFCLVESDMCLSQSLGKSQTLP